MRILAIETAVPPGSIWAGELPAASGSFHRLESSRRTTERFANVIQAAFKEQAWDAGAVDLVATSHGPGSFTGLRIGITAAKTFAYAANCDILAVNTLELIARQVDFDGEIVAVLNAQRGQVFRAVYETLHGAVNCISTTEILNNEACCDRLGRHQMISGEGLRSLSGHLTVHPLIADEASWSPRADTLARAAAEKYRAGARQDLWSLTPQYFRKSAAEEKSQRTV
jgi:tRNA threonylcarbamoyladenosine biosynthesis protein TsaB